MISIVSSKYCLEDAKSFNNQYNLLIHAYKVTEKDIWGENYVRIEVEEYKELIEKEIVFTAKLDDEIVGTILLSNHGNQTFSFGLLAADFSKKGMGIGRKLIEAVENEAIRQGANKMVLEILKPENQFVAVKQQLAAWYERLGYSHLKTVSFIDLKPDKSEKAKLLITPSVFDCYEKKLN
jgi:GNAT superfamily N-acetyltransferase